MNTQARPPIVTILGHVDHGKTTLLDYIRNSRITNKEHGGITQRIGAYEVTTGIAGYDTEKITFIDTPGHEAFSQLRARGATIADVAILVIDAKDSLKPQTIESISHIKSANIPYIVAINKIDLPEAHPEKVKNDLLKHEVIVEEKGGSVPTVSISAKQGTGIQDLLESILLVSADRRLTYDPGAPVEAYVIETKKDKRGNVASIIIKNGTITVGDTLYCGQEKVKVKGLQNDLGKSIRRIIPSMPSEMIGFNNLPQVGTYITDSTHDGSSNTRTRSETIHAPRSEEVDKNILYVIIKTDTQGSLEAIGQSLERNKHIHVILSGVGNVHCSDIFLAKSTKAIVVGFATDIDAEAEKTAKQEKVVIKTYDIIYRLLEELEEVSDLLREQAETIKNVKGEGKVLATFVIEGERVFGMKVVKGKINLGDTVRIVRTGQIVGETRLVSLKIRAKRVQEVKKDQECGIGCEPFIDIQENDIIRSIL